MCRLKQAMVAEQEDEEEKIRWRVEAEVSDIPCLGLDGQILI